VHAVIRLQSYHERIKKLEEKEMTLEELDTEDSNYILIDRSVTTDFPTIWTPFVFYSFSFIDLFLCLIY